MKMHKIVPLLTCFILHIQSTAMAGARYYDEYANDPEMSGTFDSHALATLVEAAPIFLLIWIIFLEKLPIDDNRGSWAAVVTAGIFYIADKYIAYVSIVCAVILAALFYIISCIEKENNHGAR